MSPCFKEGSFVRYFTVQSRSCFWRPQNCSLCTEKPGELLTRQRLPRFSCRYYCVCPSDTDLPLANRAYGNWSKKHSSLPVQSGCSHSCEVTEAASPPWEPHFAACELGSCRALCASNAAAPALKNSRLWLFLPVPFVCHSVRPPSQLCWIFNWHFQGLVKTSGACLEPVPAQTPCFGEAQETVTSVHVTQQQ